MKRLVLFSLLFALIGLDAFAQAKQFLYIEFTPKDATLEINGEVKETEDGIYQELLPMGQHSYKLYRDGYSTASGSILMHNQNQTKKMLLKLKRKMGYLSVSNSYGQDITGGEVYVDEVCIGKVPVSRYLVTSGEHEVTIKHPLYKPHISYCVITDEQVTAIAPTLVPNYTIVTVSSDPSSDIYINDEYMGKGSWNGKLALDKKLVFESRIVGHTPGRVEKTFRKNDNTKAINIPAPSPIYGALVVTSTPPKGIVFLDGEKMGETPLYIPSILIGEHTVQLKFNEKESLTESVTIKDGEDTQVHFKKVYGSLNIVSNPSGAIIYIHGKEYGNTPQRIDGIFVGEHTVEVKTEDATMTETVTIGKDENKELVFTFPVVEKVVEEEAFPYQMLDEKPTFKGGDAKKFSKWVNQKLVYPLVAQENGIEGRVVVQFIIEKDGTITNIKIVNSVDHALDKEALRIASMSPNWKPGKKDGNPVRTLFTFPVIFQIK